MTNNKRIKEFTGMDINPESLDFGPGSSVLRENAYSHNVKVIWMTVRESRPTPGSLGKIGLCMFCLYGGFTP